MGIKNSVPLYQIEGLLSGLRKLLEWIILAGQCHAESFLNEPTYHVQGVSQNDKIFRILDKDWLFRNTIKFDAILFGLPTYKDTAI